MMKKILLFAAIAMMLVISCNKEDEVTGRPDYGKKSIFYASAEATSIPESKVYADENLMVLWNENDCISIFSNANVNDKYMFDGEDGDNGGGFSFEEEGIEPSAPIDLGHIYAVYPYSADTQVSGDSSQPIITVNLPAEQLYKEHSFGLGANTMVAVTDGNFLGFKNVCGYLKFRFYGDDLRVKSVTLEGNNGEKIAGKAYITPSISSAPTVEMDNAATTSITLNCPSPVTIGSSTAEATEFIFVIPPTTFEGGFKVTVTDQTGVTFEKSSTRSLTISRSRMESMGAMKVDIIPDYSNLFVDFEDANFKAYCVENFDTNNDGEISYAEAFEVTRIDVITSKPYIRSLRGIEFFKNLTYLACNGENPTYKGLLTSLDVSNNTKLTALYCNFNRLTSLDVSNNTLLTELSCINNSLNSIDVSNNSALTILLCNKNNMTSIDVSNNTLLTTLWCGSNKLTSLDVSNNNALTELSCANNKLTKLDIRNNMALKTLYCHTNRLTDLNITNNTALTELSCGNNLLTSLDMSTNTALQDLHCGSNQLTSLDLSNNTELALLDCQNNQLTSLDVSGCTAIKELDCNYNKLTSLDVSNIIALEILRCQMNQLANLNLGNNFALRDLNCHTNRLASLDVSNNTKLKQLECGSNQLSTLDVSNNTTLTSLFCDSNQLTSLDVRKNTALLELTCSKNQIRKIDLKNNTLLKYLVCEENLLSSLDVSNNTALTHLRCYSNQLTSLDVSNHMALTYLQCNTNQLTILNVSGCTALTALYCFNNLLTSLNVSTNTALLYLSAWPQSETLATLWKKSGQTITYKNDGNNTIDPSDYGTEIIEVD